MTFQIFRAGRASGNRTPAPTAALTVHCKSVVLMDLAKSAALGCVRLPKRRVKTFLELFSGFCRGKYSHTAMRVREPGTSTGLKGSVELRKVCKAKVIYTADPSLQPWLSVPLFKSTMPSPRRISLNLALSSSRRQICKCMT